MKVITPRSLDEALAVKAELGLDAQVLAGGQSLAVLLQKALVAPEVLINLGELGELRQISIVDERVSLGAMVTMARTSRSPELRRAAPLLAEVCGVVASPHVRNMGTVVGNICHAEVGSDPPQALLALDAEVCARSSRGERWVSMRDWIQGYFATCLEDDEIATGLRLAPFGGKTVYLKHRVRQMDLAGVGLALAIAEQDGRIGQARIAVGGIGPRPLRAERAERQLVGLEADRVRDYAADLGRLAADEVAPVLSDGFGSAAYRKHLVAVSLRRGLQQLLTAQPGAA